MYFFFLVYIQIRKTTKEIPTLVKKILRAIALKNSKGNNWTKRLEGSNDQFPWGKNTLWKRLNIASKSSATASNNNKKKQSAILDPHKNHLMISDFSFWKTNSNKDKKNRIHATVSHTISFWKSERTSCIWLCSAAVKRGSSWAFPSKKEYTFWTMTTDWSCDTPGISPPYERDKRKWKV